MSESQWKWPYFRSQANCIAYGIEDVFAFRINNIILENFEMYTKKTLWCRLYCSFWKHNPFRDVCDPKFCNFYFFLYCLHFSGAAGYEKYDMRSISDISAFPLKWPLITRLLERAVVGELVTWSSHHLVKYIYYTGCLHSSVPCRIFPTGGICCTYTRYNFFFFNVNPVAKSCNHSSWVSFFAVGFFFVNLYSVQ